MRCVVFEHSFLLRAHQLKKYLRLCICKPNQKCQYGQFFLLLQGILQKKSERLINDHKIPWCVLFVIYCLLSWCASHHPLTIKRDSSWKFRMKWHQFLLFLALFFVVVFTTQYKRASPCFKKKVSHHFTIYKRKYYWNEVTARECQVLLDIINSSSNCEWDPLEGFVL